MTASDGSPHALAATPKPGAMPLETALGEAEFARWVREWGPSIWRTLRRMGVRESDVPDVAQDVFVTLHQKLPSFEHRSSLRTFALGIALRHASDYRRRAHVRRELGEDELPERATSAPELKELERKERLAVLDRALSLLPEETRTLLVLFEVEEVPMREIAELLGCPEKTAYSRLPGARNALRRALAREGVEEDIR